MPPKNKNTHHKRPAQPSFIDEESQTAAQASAEAEPSPVPKPVATRQMQPDVERIGDILRRVREHRGEDIESISDYLRIRPTYLYALEQSHYEELPADAYVIGFLRSYASYLGLDGRGAIDQYRREMAGARRKPQLSMPQPMPEGRAPTIAVLVGAAIAALLVYALWYGLSSPSTEPLQKPVTLSTVKQDEAPAVSSPAAQDALAPNAGAAVSSGGAPAAQQSTGLSTQTATSDGITLGVPAAATTLPAGAMVPAAEGAQQVFAGKDSGKDKTVVPPPSAGQTVAAATTQPASTEQPAAASSDAPVSTAFGETKGKSRVVIKAEKESWILVTDSKGNTVFDRTLKAGETYNVPTGKGLKLTTGNTSGVAFLLDGASLPKLKTTGKVARAVPLEPEKLKSRLSDAETPDSTDQTEE